MRRSRQLSVRFKIASRPGRKPPPVTQRPRPITHHFRGIEIVLLAPSLQRGSSRRRIEGLNDTSAPVAAPTIRNPVKASFSETLFLAAHHRYCTSRLRQTQCVGKSIVPPEATLALPSNRSIPLQSCDSSACPAPAFSSRRQQLTVNIRTRTTRPAPASPHSFR